MLDLRLKTIAHNIPQNVAIADIGTDHAKLPIALIESGKAKKAIASDVNQGPLKRAKKEIKAHNLEKKIEVRQGSGLNHLKQDDKIDVIIIAGMGGYLIRDIILENISFAYSVQQLILQPMNNVPLLRQDLLKNGFKIIKEDLAYEGNRFYEILVIQKGEMQIKDPIYFEIGYDGCGEKMPLMDAFIEMKMKKQKKIMESTVNKTSKYAREKYGSSQKILNKLLEIKNENKPSF